MGVKDYWIPRHRRAMPASRLLRHPSLAALLMCSTRSVPNLAAYTANSSNTRPDLDRRSAHGRACRALHRVPEQQGTTKADMLRLNVAIKPHRDSQAAILGVVARDSAGFPNGRRVFDDVVSIELKAVAVRCSGDVVKSFKPDAAAGALYDVGGTASGPASVRKPERIRLNYQGLLPVSRRSWTALTTRRHRASSGRLKR